MPKTTEIVVNANPKHRGIVDLKTTGKDEKGCLIGKNGIRWSL